MTRNMIFASAIGVILVAMLVGSLFSDEGDRPSDERGFDVNVEIGTDSDEIVITSERGNTVVHSRTGRQECSSGQDVIVVTRADGSQTRIEC